jgi:hypothetical protein
MPARATLTLLFTLILIAMVAVTGWASLMQPVWEWRGLVAGPDHAWTIATLCDAYCGFLTFYAWVFYKERAPGRIGWFVLIMAFGNMAMAGYVLRELGRLGPHEPAHALLLRRAG